MKGPVSFFIAAVLLLGGCSSRRELSTESRNADDAITSAERAGARRYAGQNLEGAKADLARARVAEDAAVRDRNAASQQLELARRRDERARRRIQTRNVQLAEDAEERKTQLTALDVLSQHADELRAKGVDEEEVSRLVKERQSMIKIRVKQLDAQIESLDRDIAAMEAVRKDSALEIQTAQARLRSADDRLEASRALYLQVEQRANLARAEALDARREELSRKIGSLTP